jgi:hypothetical protein
MLLIGLVLVAAEVLAELVQLELLLFLVLLEMEEMGVLVLSQTLQEYLLVMVVEVRGQVGRFPALLLLVMVVVQVTLVSQLQIAEEEVLQSQVEQLELLLSDILLKDPQEHP